MKTTLINKFWQPNIKPDVLKFDTTLSLIRPPFLQLKNGPMRGVAFLEEDNLVIFEKKHISASEILPDKKGTTIF